MKTCLLILFCFYFTIEFMGSFVAWVNPKNEKEYWWRFVDTLVSAGMIFAFIKLVQILTEVG